MFDSPLMSGALLVRGADVLLPGGNVSRADILIVAGRIAEIGEVTAPRGIAELDARGQLVVPGLVNAHTHSGENFNPGRYENLPLDLWFVYSHEVTRGEPPDRDTIYTRTALGAIQMLLSGTTCAVDFLYEAPAITVETLEPVVQAYRDAGLRVNILLGVADKPFLESLPLDPEVRTSAPPEAAPPSLHSIMELAEAAVERWHEPGGLTGIGLAPSAPQRCSEELMQASREFALRHELVWHTHVLETKTQAWTAQQWHGKSFVETLHEDGFLGPRSSVVHAVWLTDRDIEILRETGTTMIHCLLSNLRLGDGVARLTALRDAEVTVALGTDGRGCDETLDMFELAKTTAVLHKARGESYERWPTAQEVFEMATVGGSRCAGHGERLGRIEPGAAGDLVLLDRHAVALTPFLHPVRQLVYGSAGRDVRTVVVDGRVVVEDGRVLGLNVDAVLKRAVRYAEPLAARGGAELRRLEEIVNELYAKAERAAIGLDSYVGSGLTEESQNLPAM